jgi:hypothetical protein
MSKAWKILLLLYSIFKGTLLEAIISQHSTLQGIAQQLAEVYYIVGSQQVKLSYFTFSRVLLMKTMKN